MISGLSQAGVVEALAERTESPTSEQDDSLQLLVEEEIVETPDGAVLPKRIRGEVRVVRVYVALEQINFCVESVPEFVMDLAVLTGG